DAEAGRGAVHPVVAAGADVEVVGGVRPLRPPPLRELLGVDPRREGALGRDRDGPADRDRGGLAHRRSPSCSVPPPRWAANLSRWLLHSSRVRLAHSRSGSRLPGTSVTVTTRPLLRRVASPPATSRSTCLSVAVTLTSRSAASAVIVAGPDSSRSRSRRRGALAIACAAESRAVAVMRRR